MTSSSEQPPRADDEDVREETSPAQGTPPIADDAEKGQTQVPAPEDDVGVPEDTEDRTD